MPLCIAGMHRSGTSMLTSLLQACGLQLGPAKDLLPPAPSNPEGFWESRSFVRINEHLLRELGGNWDHPPQAAAAGWEDEPRWHRLHGEARKLVRRFRACEPWGWKDPRNCLTFPFWRKVVPDLKTLICVRNPLAVAESLRQRDNLSLATALDLWLTYNQRILAAAPLTNRLVTHCETYFHDPETELRRVLKWLGIAAPKACVRKACQRFNPSLVHHHMTEDDLTQTKVSARFLHCYRELWDEADSSRRTPSVNRALPAR
jgi:hypothetical protein